MSPSETLRHIGRAASVLARKRQCFADRFYGVFTDYLELFLGVPVKICRRPFTRSITESLFARVYIGTDILEAMNQHDQILPKPSPPVGLSRVVHMPDRGMAYEYVTSETEPLSMIHSMILVRSARLSPATLQR